jgi:HD-like signal output (HDOD) protein
MSTNGKKSLVGYITEYLASNKLELPVFHSVALRLQQLVSKNTFTIEQVLELISEDQALASKVLRLANSPFYAGLNEISTLRDAIIRLGSREVGNLTMVASQEDVYRSENEAINSYMSILWSHATACAAGSKWLAIASGYRNLAQEAFLAGLLHDIGKLFLLRVVDDLTRTGQMKTLLSEALIREVLDRLHTDQGLELMKKWNLPDIYCNVVRDHHSESCNPQDMLLVLVRLTNLACRKAGVGMHREPHLVLLTTPEAGILGLKEIALAELELCIEDTVGMA